MTIGVDVEDGVIVWAPPIVKKFVGQSIDNLKNWMKSMDNDGYKCLRMEV